jgi:hypothetical protein
MRTWRTYGSLGKLHNIVTYIRRTPQRIAAFKCNGGGRSWGSQGTRVEDRQILGARGRVQKHERRRRSDCKRRRSNCQRQNRIEYKRLREKRKERKETKDRGQAPHISNSHATTSNRELIKERTECSRNINPYNDTPRSPRDVEPNNNRKNHQS